MVSEEFSGIESEAVASVEGDGVAPLEPTGNPAVDAVLATLDDLDRTPVSEQVSLFESAHERLRAALTDAGNDPSV